MSERRSKGKDLVPSVPALERDFNVSEADLSVATLYRWVALTGMTGVATGPLDDALRELWGAAPIWVPLDGSGDPRLDARVEDSQVSFVVVDAVGHREATEVARKLGEWLHAHPKRRFLLVTGASLGEPDVPAYLGEGLAVPVGGSAEDASLLRHARRIVPKYGLDDIVLGPRTRLKLEEAVGFARTKDFCEREWGFRAHHSRGHAVTLLFHGESGTGKTMAAEVVASALGLPLYQVDLSSVISKWVGETEKNLKAIFNAAKGVKGILLFDEGDALFGTRTEMKGSQDRYANLEVNYLLQEIEAFDGIAVLSTNHVRYMDPAFLRRFTFSITFGRPDEAQRKKIWEKAIPPRMPLAGDVDFNHLSVFQLTGGNIRNCVRDAAARAASFGKPAVGHEDFLWAVKRELQKYAMGVTRGQLGEDYWRRVGTEWEYKYFGRADRKAAPRETAT